MAASYIAAKAAGTGEGAYNHTVNIHQEQIMGRLRRRYKVTVRRPGTDPSQQGIVIETQEIVNAKPHALNLAKKILVEDGLPWVEVNEVDGRFHIRLTRGADGMVYEAPGTRRKGASPGISALGWAALVCWGLTLLSLAVMPPRSGQEDLNPFASLFGVIAMLLTVGWARGHRARRKKRARVQT